MHKSVLLPLALAASVLAPSLAYSADNPIVMSVEVLTVEGNVDLKNLVEGDALLDSGTIENVPGIEWVVAEEVAGGLFSAFLSKHGGASMIYGTTVEIQARDVAFDLTDPVEYVASETRVENEDGTVERNLDTATVFPGIKLRLTPTLGDDGAIGIGSTVNSTDVSSFQRFEDSDGVDILLPRTTTQNFVLDSLIPDGGILLLSGMDYFGQKVVVGIKVTSEGAEDTASLH